MHPQPAGEGDRFWEGVIGADVMTLLVVEMLAHESLGQFALVEQFLDLGRVLVLELLVKALKFLPHVGQDARALAAGLVSGGQHHVELAFRARQVGAAVRLANGAPEGRTEAHWEPTFMRWPTSAFLSGQHRYTLDFDIETQKLRANGRTGGLRFAEVAHIHLVHFPEILRL